MKSLITCTRSIGILALFLLACNGEVTKSFEAKATALGKMNEIVVIADDNVWDGMVGDSFKYYFGSAYPIMPSPEPMFDLRHFTTEDLYAEPLRKELRTYVVLADLSDFDSPTTRMVKKDIGDTRIGEAMRNPEISSSVGRDKWARNQLMIYLFGKDRQTLAHAISSNFSAAAKRVNEHDEKQLKERVYAFDLNLGYQAKLEDYFNVKLEIPADYKEAKFVEEDPMLWLRKDTKDAILNMVFFKIPYVQSDQFTKQMIIDKINEYGTNYVDSEKADDVFVVNQDDLPVYEYAAQIDGQYAKELRGLWEMTNSFSGGPFTANLITTESGKDLVLVLSYVYAPGEEKRDLIQQLDYMVKQMEL